MIPFLDSINRILGALIVIAILGLLLTTLLGLSARSFWLGDIFANVRLQ